MHHIALMTFEPSARPQIFSICFSHLVLLSCEE